MLDRDIQKLSGGASKDTRYQNEMLAAKKRDVEAFERRIEEIESRIRDERNRMKRKGGEVDAAYRDAFERKVSEVEAYVSSLGRTLNTGAVSSASLVSSAIMRTTAAPALPVAKSKPVSMPSVQAKSARTGSETGIETPKVACCSGCGCIFAGVLGMLYAAFTGNMAVLAIASIIVFSGLGIGIYSSVHQNNPHS